VALRLFFHFPRSCLSDHVTQRRKVEVRDCTCRPLLIAHSLAFQENSEDPLDDVYEPAQDREARGFDFTVLGLDAIDAEGTGETSQDSVGDTI
jgi:hypothetical protein